MNTKEKNTASLLLGRDTPPVYDDRAIVMVKGKTVLVTGGGGSIGSEIVYQLSCLGAKVFCLDNDEYSLYELSMRLNGNALFTGAGYILADIRDRDSLFRIINEICPDIVFHAAAYKHLPLLEEYPTEGIRTNVLGTYNVAQACIKCGVGHMINISTDKAADPSSVLGLTKRLAELCVSAYAHESETRFASVRFGNVLGSRGSLLPTIAWQIERGKPLTITHPDITRYFMTIPEAAGLVIEAATLIEEGGEIFILDMGEPIKILDLIGRYIEIRGCNMPEIVYVGLRPGEKVYETLFGSGEIQMPTSNPKISKTRTCELVGILPEDLADIIILDGKGAKQGIQQIVERIEKRLLEQQVICRI